MRTFQINGLGTCDNFSGETEQQARDSCAINAGYKSEVEMIENLGSDAELVVEEVGLTQQQLDLRALWDKKGVPKERQDHLIAQICAKAAPGSQIGPFMIPTEDNTMRGEVGRHDWCIGHGCEDGYPVFVDDRQLSYRKTPELARAYALEIIERIQADGDYRLNDKLSGFLPPQLLVAQGSMEKPPICVTVHVIQISSNENLDVDDLNVAGVYEVRLPSTLPLENYAGVALDAFHSSVSVAVLEDFEFSVCDAQGIELNEDENYIAYSSKLQLDITKISDSPEYFVQPKM